MFRWVGYNNGWEYTHTIKAVDWGQEDTYELDLRDDLGRKYHIELIMDVAEHDYVVAWQKWQHYKVGKSGVLRPSTLSSLRNTCRLLRNGMQLRYMIEYALRDRDTDPHYEPIGVWVINRLVENDIKSLLEDFLEYHQQTMSPCIGMRGKVIETDQHDSAEVCADLILQQIRRAVSQ